MMLRELKSLLVSPEEAHIMLTKRTPVMKGYCFFIPLWKMYGLYLILKMCLMYKQRDTHLEEERWHMNEIILLPKDFFGGIQQVMETIFQISFITPNNTIARGIMPNNHQNYDNGQSQAASHFSHWGKLFYCSIWKIVPFTKLCQLFVAAMAPKPCVQTLHVIHFRITQADLQSELKVICQAVIQTVVNKSSFFSSQ